MSKSDSSMLIQMRDKYLLAELKIYILGLNYEWLHICDNRFAESKGLLSAPWLFCHSLPKLPGAAFVYNENN